MLFKKGGAINMYTLHLSSETEKGAIYPTSCVLQKMRRKRRFALLFSIVSGDELVFFSIPPPPPPKHDDQQENSSLVKVAVIGLL